MENRLYALTNDTILTICGDYHEEPGIIMRFLLNRQWTFSPPGEESEEEDVTY
jgi:hypothetical protein